jgi:hypothetical protein
MARSRRPRDEEDRKREAERLIDRAARDSGVPGAGLTRTAHRVGRHFAAADAEAGDPAELWGTRIGRGLALIFLVGLIVWLAKTYLFA